MVSKAYAEEARHIVQDLIDHTSQTDIAFIRGWLAAKGSDAWLAWRQERQAAVCAFAAASQTQRDERPEWNLPESGPLFRLAALQILCAGFHMLDVIDQHQLYPGPSYEDMAVQAGLAQLRLWLRCDPYHWPFEAPTPFEDWALFSSTAPSCDPPGLVASC